MSLENDISAAYEDVRNDKTETKWLIATYADDKSDKIVLSSTGRFFI